MKDKVVKNCMFSDTIKGFTFTNSIENDYFRFFAHFGKHDIAEHCSKVAKEAKRLAAHYGVSQEEAEIAGFMHDISRIFPDNEFVNIALELGIEVNGEEKIYPGLLHQKISKVFARELFCVIRLKFGG